MSSQVRALNGVKGAVDPNAARAFAQGVALLRVAKTPAEVGGALEALKRTLDPKASVVPADYVKAPFDKVMALRDATLSALTRQQENPQALATADGALTQLAALSSGEPNRRPSAMDRIEQLVQRPPDKAAERSAAELTAYAQARQVHDVSDEAPGADRLRHAAKAALRLKQETFAPKERVVAQTVGSSSQGKLVEKPATKPDDVVTVRDEWVKDFSEPEARKAAGNMGLRLRLLHSASEGSPKATTYTDLIDALATNPDLLTTTLLDPGFEQPASWRWVDSKIAPILQKDGWSIERPEYFKGAMRFTATALVDRAFDTRPEVREAVKALWPALQQEALAAAKAPLFGPNAQDNYLRKLRIARWEMVLGVLSSADRAKFHTALGLDNEFEQRRLHRSAT